MKNRLPRRFWMPPWLFPTRQKISPTPRATAKAAAKCTVRRNGWRARFRRSRPHSRRICLEKGAMYLTLASCRPLA